VITVTKNSKPFQKPFIIPIFVPHMGCPHRCVFCNQTSITGADPYPFREAITERLRNHLRSQPKRGGRKEVAFYGGSFTGMEKAVQVYFLSTVQPFIEEGLIDSVRISTRPDYADPQTLDLLKEHGVMTVELGVQSMVDEVLRRSRRGHTADDARRAAKLLQGHGLEMGIQIMIGLPGDDTRRNAETVDRVILLNPHFVRIYPTLVLKGTLLEEWYRSGRYIPLSLEEAVDLCKRAFLKFSRAGIPVIRLGLQSSPELETEDCVVAGPYHPAFGHLVESSLFYDMASHLMGRMRGSQVFRAKVSPADLSNIRGQKNGNLDQLSKQFNLKHIHIEVDEQQPRGSLFLMNGTKRDWISYRTLPFHG
jgi:histone acetyltransferase (RNA polymerase elongator complex component)